MGYAFFCRIKPYEGKARKFKDALWKYQLNPVISSVRVKLILQSFWERGWNKTSLKDGLLWSEAGNTMMPGLSAYYLGRKLDVCIRTRFYYSSEVLAIRKKKRSVFAESRLNSVLFLRPTGKENLQKLFLYSLHETSVIAKPPASNPCSAENKL